MKTLAVILGVTLAMGLSSNVIAQNKAKEEVKTIEKRITITDDGKRIIETTINGETSIDTLMLGERMKMPGKMHMRMKDKNFPMCLGEDMDLDVEFDGDSSRIFVIKRPGGIEEYKFMGEPGLGRKHKVFVKDLRGEGLPCEMPVHQRRGQHMNRRLIDLNDPNITSFERETLKDGSEKIVIIRKTPARKKN